MKVAKFVVLYATVALFPLVFGTSTDYYPPQLEITKSPLQLVATAAVINKYPKYAIFQSKHRLKVSIPSDAELETIPGPPDSPRR